jgi:hypothetical protein
MYVNFENIPFANLGTWQCKEMQPTGEVLNSEQEES